MDQSWFEMRELRRRTLDYSVWTPLRACERKVSGDFGHVGYQDDSFALWSLAVPIEHRERAEALSWQDPGLSHSHRGWVVDGRYVQGDVSDVIDRKLDGLALVLKQDGNRQEVSQWHLHQDMVISLGLKREGDVWVAINEGYCEVARIQHESDGSPARVELRTEYLKDYLCARGMALRILWYRGRWEVVEDASHIVWQSNPLREESTDEKWEGRVMAIHEGGEQFGSSAAVLHIGRENVDFQVDVPIIGRTDANFVSRSWTIKHEGRKLFTVRGEVWHKEWVNPASQSPRIRGDKVPSRSFFVVDSGGTQESEEELRASGCWLWFRPNVVTAIMGQRGAALEWYTRDTGRLWHTPSSIVFGMNKLGLVNVYAKDISLLPAWQQRIWAGFNLRPEGGVSDELLASQAVGIPASTEAPEAFFARGIQLLNEIGTRKLGCRIFRHHNEFQMLMANAHRFRAVDKSGLFSLAKDVARLTADLMDRAALQKIVAPKGENWGSLKSLEHVIAKFCGHSKASSVLGPLHGAYNLRHADAHLPSDDLSEAYTLLRIDTQAPIVVQGYQLLNSCVGSLYEIVKLLV